MSNFLVNLVFLTVVNAIGQGQTFWIFAFICAFRLWFVGRYLPETRDRDFDQIDSALQARAGHWTEQYSAIETPASFLAPGDR
jgi:MFS transporter, SP family, galactose:H+ symporter